jgi:hypothetical protein
MQAALLIVASNLGKDKHGKTMVGDDLAGKA